MITVRTPPDERLIWYAATPYRSAEAIRGLGVLDGYHGDPGPRHHAGWAPFDAQLAGVQQCRQHLSRHLEGVQALHPHWQRWAEDVRHVLNDAHRAVGDAIAAGQPALDPALLAGLRERCDQAVHWGEIARRHRGWDDAKNHPGYVLARRRNAKAEQVWLFTRNFAVPWARKRQRAGHQGPKRHQAVCGCWHALDTLSRYYRVRTYLVSIRDHGIPPIDASTPPLPDAPGYQSQSAPDANRVNGHG